MDSLNTKYVVRDFTSKDWNIILDEFSDSSLYQTDAFIKNSKGGNISEKFLLLQNDEVIAATQVRIKVIPNIQRGIAYVRWGPMWRKKNVEEDIAIFNQAVSSLIDEYVIKRKLYLRITPHIIQAQYPQITESLKKFGMRANKNILPYHTFILDLSNELDDIKRGFVKDWRRRLKKCSENNLEVLHDTSEGYFSEFIVMYNEMRKRKQFKEYVNIDDVIKIQQNLCSSKKLRVLLCKFEKETIGAFVISAIGNSGIALLAGSSTKGLKLSSSILLHWNVIKWLKENGFDYYDLGGIDPQNNPSVYNFKKGAMGKEIKFIGSYDICESKLSQLIVSLYTLIKN